MRHLGSALRSEEYLNINDYIRSENGIYVAVMQEDSNLVVYRGAPYSGEPLWASNTVLPKSSRFALMQSDGNLVLYEGTPGHRGSPFWASNTARDSDVYFLAMQNDGNLVIYKGNPAGGEPYRHEAIWASNTAREEKNVRHVGSNLRADGYLNVNDYLRSENGAYVATMQEDGNFVVYKGASYSGEALWASNTVMAKGSRFAAMQRDGNLVLYHGTPGQKGTPYWAAQTNRNTDAFFLAMQNDGNLVIYRGDPAGGEPYRHEAIWASRAANVNRDAALGHGERGHINRRIGKYELRRMLGEGAFGVTWEAWDTVADDKVALKLLKNVSGGLEALRREVRPLLNLNTKHVISYSDCNYFRDETGRHIFYLATEFADQGTLEDKLKGVLSVEQAVSCCIDLLTGLAVCHDRSILHRDLKPDNIFFNGTTLKIGDFGLAIVTEQTIRLGDVVGTPAYMAPEQFTGTTSRRTDLWAAGVILYRMVYRALPFVSLEEIRSNSIRASTPELPGHPGLAQIIQKALAKSEAARFQSAGDFLHGLKRL